jgi:hypothetical protein
MVTVAPRRIQDPQLTGQEDSMRVGSGAELLPQPLADGSNAALLEVPGLSNLSDRLTVCHPIQVLNFPGI